MPSVHDQIVQNSNMTNAAKMQQQMQDGVRQSKSNVSSNDFLFLLTQQLQYQDPTNPMDNSEMLAQEAQFATLEQMENLSNSFSNFSSNFQANMLLGQCVRVEVDGQGYVGYVDAVDYTSANGASLLIGDRWFPMSSVTNLYYISGEAQPQEPSEPAEPKAPSELDKTKDGIVQETNPDVMLPTAGHRIGDIPLNKDDNSENSEKEQNTIGPVADFAAQIIGGKVAKKAYEAVKNAF